MGQFSNGTEGMRFEEEFCSRCLHIGDEEHGCPVVIAHLLYDYQLSQQPEHPGKIILDMLIPIDSEGWNEACRMFAEAPSGEQMALNV